MADKIQAIRGMNDVLPEEAHLWRFFEDAARSVFEQYGYRRSLDILPFLVALATIGGGWTGSAWLPRGTPLFRAALVVSVLINVYFLIEIHRFGYAR